MADSPHRLNITDQKDVRIVEFVESKILDEGNIAEIGDTLTGMIEAKNHPKLLLDFANVDHLSSAALGMLIDVNKKIRAQSGQLRLVNIQPQIFEVFKITRLNNMFKILPSRTEALTSFT